MGTMNSEDLARFLAQNKQQPLHAFGQTMKQAFEQMGRHFGGQQERADFVRQRAGGGGHGQSGEGMFSERACRGLPKFDGKEGRWVVWCGKFLGLVMERSPGMARAMKWVAEQPIETTLKEVGEVDPDGVQDDLERWSAALKNRLVRGLEGAAYVVQSAVAESNGFETWRRIVRKYDPKTPTRAMQLMVRVMVP